MRLIIATRNKGKVREISEILKGLKLAVVSLGDISFKSDIEENGRTFFANARKKAIAVSKIYRSDYVAGEDSGLAVGYLKGRPGVRSRRFAGPCAGDEENNLKLLRELDGVRQSGRRASYYCCVVLARGGKFIKKFEARLPGFIAGRPRGNNGFGYDPIFYLPQYKKTAAQIPLKEKNKISHRAKVFGKVKRYLLEKKTIKPDIFSASGGK
jgi:XTP/dITP diphosphohydrolase